MYSSKLHKYRFAFRILFWIAVIVAFVFAVLPKSMVPTIQPLSDKAQHMLAFTVLGILLLLGYKINYWVAFLILVGYGSFIEIAQLFAINRSSELNDVLADTIGVFIGFTLYKYLNKTI